jgi:hypothetical protein
MERGPNVSLVILAERNNPILCYAPEVLRLIAVRDYPPVFSIEFEQALAFAGEPQGSVFIFQHSDHTDWHPLAGTSVVKRKIRDLVCGSI